MVSGGSIRNGSGMKRVMKGHVRADVKRVSTRVCGVGWGCHREGQVEKCYKR